MQDTDDVLQQKKARRKAIGLKISIWAALVSAILGIPTPVFGAAAFIGAGIGMVGLFRLKHIRRRRWYYALAIFTVAIGFLTVSPWRDAPPLADDYTIADLVSADSEFHHTYEMLVSLYSGSGDDPDVVAIAGLTRREANYLREIHQSRPDELSDLATWYEQHRRDLLGLWDKTEEARKIVSRLAEYEQIADLAEPGFSDEDRLTTDSFRTLAYLYMNVVPLMIQDGRIEDGLDELFTWNSFIRTLSVTARDLITKLTCYGSLSGCIETANEIANGPEINGQVLAHLQNNFPPLTQEELSLRNPLIFDYLTSVKEYAVFGASPLQKKQSSIRLMRNLTDHTIARCEGLAEPDQLFSVWPFWLRFMPDVGTDVDAFRPWYYFYYNPAGSLLFSILHTPMEKSTQLAIGLQIRNDLLQCVLSYRLQGGADLSARAYGEKYIIDVERKRIYSPGPDGIPFTKDDIWLPIEPAVLGLTE